MCQRHGSGARSAGLRSFLLPFLLVVCGRLPGADKNGVSPQAISLPSGPGSIQGLGESFQPQLNTGSGRYAVDIRLPRGPGGQTPELRLLYDSGSGNGPVGLGWRLAGLHALRRSTDDGVPRYVDGPNGVDDDQDGVIDNPGEVDRFTGMDGEELVEVGDGQFLCENESSFVRYERRGAAWTARSKRGVLYELGTSPGARIAEGGKTFAWLVERITDTSGNTIRYTYRSDPESPAQKYVSTVSWGTSGAYFAAVFRYEAGRPDAFTSLRSGLEIRTGLRLAAVDVISHGVPARGDAARDDFDGDGASDALIRRYELEYREEAHLSLLSRLTWIGCDGVSALPPRTFRYTRWSAPEDVSESIVRSRDEPPVGLDSGSMELADLNGDGLPDLLSTVASRHQAFLNRGIDETGRLAWSSATPVGNAPDIDVASGRAHLADATADGLSDLVVKVSNTRFLCFDNTSDTAWRSPRGSLSNTDSWPVWPFDGPSGRSSRSIDCDYNRSNDVLFTSSSGYRLWMLLPGGRYSREIRIAPLRCDGKTFSFDRPGARIADVNGDRLQDLVWVQTSRVVYWANRGRGRFAGPVVHELGAALASGDIDEADLSDLDGDGMVDLAVVRPSSRPRGVLYWLNRFERGFEGPRHVDGLPALRSGDTLRWADMNGNGSTDLLISNAARPPGAREQVIDLVGGSKPYLLARVENGLGLTITMDYESSIDQMLRAAADGDPWSRTMPFGVPVLRRIREDDGLGNSYVREFTYRDPYYDAAKQEFRGFEHAVVREVGDAGAPTQIERHEYDTGDVADCLKGKPVVHEVAGEEGGVFTRTETQWSHRVVGRDDAGREVCYAFPEAVDRMVFEGGEESERLRRESEFDDFGNVVRARDFGRVAEEGDELFVRREYTHRPERWQMALLAREVTTDAEGRRAAERRYAYDERGRLVRREAWLDTEDRFVPELRKRYDAFGNVVEVTDARGHRRSFVFDETVHAWPVEEVVHLEERRLRTTAEYDLGFGSVVSSVDFAGAESEFGYDVFGRLTGVARPGGAGAEYRYEPGNPISRTVRRVRTGVDGETHASFVYSDGYGRELGSKVEGEGGSWRFVDARTFNARKMVARRWLPYSTPTADYETPDPEASHHVLTYDAAGRVVREEKPDGSFVRTVHEPLVEHVWDEMDTAGAGSPTTSRRDGLGRVVEVVERDGEDTHRTRHGYTTLGDLERIIDAQGNVTTFDYDSLRRRVAVHDPDRGTVRYEHDDTGNVVRTTDARGQVIEYTYDAANRMLTQDYVGAGGGIEVAYRYDAPSGPVDLGDGRFATPAFTGGRLVSVRDPSGEEHISYDARGNEVWRAKVVIDPEIDVPVSYTTEFEYDAMDRRTGVVYPDGDRVRYVYNRGSFLERIDGGREGRVVLAGIDRTATGKMASVVFGNGVATSFEYDRRDRLAARRTVSPESEGALEYVHSTYGYDRVSNVTRITDERPFSTVPRSSPRRNTRSFEYDDLYRLTRFELAPADRPEEVRARIDYAYDRIGNIVRKSTPGPGEPGHVADQARVDLGELSYGGGRSSREGRQPGGPPGPHAVTSTEGGGTYAYDANGNMTRIEGATLRWDFEDRLVQYERGEESVRYVVDHEGRRVVKSRTVGRRTDTTIYVNPFFEVRPGRAPVKYVYRKGARVARVQGTIDPARPRIQRLYLAAGWNPVAVAVETPATVAELFGDEARAFTRVAGRHEPVPPDDPVPVGRPLWVLVPQARVAVAKGAYRPRREPIPVQGPSASIAWPRLEPFVPSAHLAPGSPGAAELRVFDAASSLWLRGGGDLPPFLDDLGRSAPAAQPVWIASDAGATVLPAGSEAQDIVFYHDDHLGSASLVTDARGRVVQETYFYPYGEVRFEHVADPDLPFRSTYSYTGMERDRESGLSYHGARYYAPWLGRWISCDPAGQKDGLDPYRYVHNNPLRSIDPTGTERRSKYERDFDENYTKKERMKVFVETVRGASKDDDVIRAGQATTEAIADYTLRKNDLSGRPLEDWSVVEYERGRKISREKRLELYREYLDVHAAGKKGKAFSKEIRFAHNVFLNGRERRDIGLAARIMSDGSIVRTKDMAKHEMQKELEYGSAISQGPVGTLAGGITRWATGDRELALQAARMGGAVDSIMGLKKDVADLKEHYPK